MAPRCRLVLSKICNMLIGGSAHPIIRYVSWVQNDVNQFGLSLKHRLCFHARCMILRHFSSTWMRHCTQGPASVYFKSSSKYGHSSLPTISDLLHCGSTLDFSCHHLSSDIYLFFIELFLYRLLYDKSIINKVFKTLLIILFLCVDNAWKKYYQ